jgi:hypothetical protein
MEEQYLELKTKLIDVNDNLRKILNNFRKAPNRLHSKEHLNKKLNEIEILKRQSSIIYDEIYGKIKLKQLTEQHLNVIIKETDTLYETIATIIQEQLLELRNTEEDKRRMSAFNYDTALKLPCLTENSEVAARDFLDCVEAYHDLLNDAGKILLMNFVVKTKIQGHAKTKLGSRVAETFNSLKLLVQESCGTTETHESLKLKLSNFKQGQKSIEEFAEAVNGITEQLAALEIKRQRASGAAEAAIRSMASKEALSTFKRGLRSNIKLVVEASKPADVQEALQVASSAQANLTDDEPQVRIACFVCQQTNHTANQCRFNFNRRGYQNNAGYRPNSFYTGYNPNAINQNSNNYRQNNNATNRNEYQQNFNTNNRNDYFNRNRGNFSGNRENGSGRRENQNLSRNWNNQNTNNNNGRRSNQNTIERNWQGRNSEGGPRVNSYISNSENEQAQPEQPGQQQLGNHRQ